jgi:hypothetical protein
MPRDSVNWEDINGGKKEGQEQNQGEAQESPRH